MPADAQEPPMFAASDFAFGAGGGAATATDAAGWIEFAAFIAFFGAAARITFVGRNAALVPLFTAFIAFIAAARIAFAMTRREVSTIPLKCLKTGDMLS